MASDWEYWSNPEKQQIENSSWRQRVKDTKKWSEEDRKTSLLNQCQPEDPIIQKVIAKFKGRSAVGFKKYTISMADNPMELEGWLIALQEELMDATNYIERIIQELEEK